MKRINIVILALVAILGFLQYRLWFQAGGISDMIRLKKLLSEQTLENDKLKKRNETLLFQVQRLQRSKDASESRARSELGMIKQGETFYQIIRKDENK